MYCISRYFAAAAVTATCVVVATVGRADDGDRDDRANRYVMTPLVSNQSGKATHQDPVLQNSWGVAFSPSGSPFWIADNDTGCSTLYDGAGVKQGLQVLIPLPGGGVPATDCMAFNFNNPPTTTPAAPTGMIWNPSANFTVPGSASIAPPKGIAAVFIWATEDGTISAWAPGLAPAGNPVANNAVLAVDNSQAGPGAVYKGLAFATNVHGAFLFATNFRAGTIDVFGPPSTAGGLFTAATTDGGFVDPDIPAGFAPFGIQYINGDLFVTYAKQNQQKHDDVAGPGNGFVDVFDTNGFLLRRFASRGPLNSPWGVARASFAFGRFSGDILVGNFGNGKINVFDSRGHFIDELDDPTGKSLVIDGLWTLILGGGAKSSSDTLYFTAGPNGETDGLFGTITPAPDNDDN
ncbi:MAG: TIGR03118 family protein [Alphaproteobacteria bacterium]|nr:TIGR03118 family protein [Alphaproteobacteria bacterium]